MCVCMQLLLLWLFFYSIFQIFFLQFVFKCSPSALYRWMMCMCNVCVLTWANARAHECVVYFDDFSSVKSRGCRWWQNVWYTFLLYTYTTRYGLPWKWNGTSALKKSKPQKKNRPNHFNQSLWRSMEEKKRRRTRSSAHNNVKIKIRRFWERKIRHTSLLFKIKWGGKGSIARILTLLLLARKISFKTQPMHKILPNDAFISFFILHFARLFFYILQAASSSNIHTYGCECMVLSFLSSLFFFQNCVLFGWEKEVWFKFWSVCRFICAAFSLSHSLSALHLWRLF